MLSKVARRGFAATVKQAAPLFKAPAYFNGLTTVDLESYRGKYVVLFFWPLDFTFVCPTEITQFSDASKKFKDLNAEVIGVSVDSQFAHEKWSQQPRSEGGIGEMEIPLVADLTKQISRDYGVLFEEMGVALRGTFIIDKAGILRHSSINDLPIGRSVEESLRLVQAIKFNDENGDVCPAGWTPGKPTMEGSHTSEKTKSYWKKVMA